MVLQSQLLVLQSKKALEIFEMKPDNDAKQHIKQRVQRTIKQRLERVQKQIDANKLSPNNEMEIQQILNPIESLLLPDYFKPIITSPINSVTNTSIYRYAN